MRHTAGTILVLVMLLFSITVQAVEDDAIVFSTAPTYNRAETIRLYTPLMNYLSEVTGRKFVIDPAANFVEYSVRMRLKKYDILFDSSHLTGWRMVNMAYTPIVRLPGSVTIVVLAAKDSDLSSFEEMGNGRSRICAFTSPDMTTMAFLSYFPNPAHQPFMLRSKNVPDLLDCLKRNRGDAAVMSSAQWESLGAKEKAQLKVVSQPKKGYPERTFSVGPKIGDPLRRKIAEALLSDEGTKVCQPFLEKFHKGNFIAVNAQEYAGLDLLLKPVWGFHAR